MSASIERFVSFLEEDLERGCWRWTGYLMPPMGYGIFKSEPNKNVRAHRWAYEYFREPIPTGLTLDHLCCNPSCVNPWHLEAVTREENIQRSRNWHREKTHCPQGHSYADAYVLQKDGWTERRCRVCHRDYVRRWDRARRTK